MTEHHAGLGHLVILIVVILLVAVHVVVTVKVEEVIPVHDCVRNVIFCVLCPPMA